MPPRLCAFCGNRFRRLDLGRAVTPDQWAEAMAYHAPDAPPGDWVCDKCRKNPPSPSTKKHRRSTSTTTSTDTDTDTEMQQTQHATTTTSSTGLAGLSDVATNLGAAMLATLATAPAPRHLVVPYVEARRKTDETWPRPVAVTTSVTSTSVTNISATSTSSSATFTAQIGTSKNINGRQWSPFSKRLMDSVLTPNGRINHMNIVLTIEESQTYQGKVDGRYLQVMDGSLPSDDPTTRTGTVIGDLYHTVKSHQSSTSEEKKVGWELLKKAFPMSLTSHKQQAYTQMEVPSKKGTPCYRSKAIVKHADIYTRLISASNDAVKVRGNPSLVSKMPIDPYASVFTATVTVDGFHAATKPVKDLLRRVAREAQARYTSQTIRPLHAIEADHAFDPPIDGFGINGLQSYFKVRLCITWLHDELMWCSALNYMMVESVGCALWIAINLNALKHQFTVDEIDTIFTKGTKGLMEVGELLDLLVSKKIQMEYVFQKPGQIVSSPLGTGAAHLVIADGIFMTQLAWNHAFSTQGIHDCLTFWGEQERTYDHISTDNGSMATTPMVPLYTMQTQGYDIGLGERIEKYERCLAQRLKDAPHTVVVRSPSPPMCNLYCTVCYNRQDWMLVDGKCVFCELKDAFDNE